MGLQRSANQEANSTILATAAACLALMATVFVVTVTLVWVPALRRRFVGSVFLLVSGAIFLVTGSVLALVSRRGVTQRLLRRSLMLGGIGSIGIVVGAVLHNVFNAVGVVTGHIVPLRYVATFLEVVSFILATIVCPVGLVIGVLGSIVGFVREGKASDGTGSTCD